MDLLSASYNDDKIAWYKNIDGLGNFSEPDIIASPDGANDVFSADIDGDGDLDVLYSASNHPLGSYDKIAWIKNLDGQGDFGAQIIISTNLENVKSIHAADLDGDGDMDVLSASADDNKLAWYENTNGLGSFGTQQIITTEPNGLLDVYTSDLDGDNDMDILSAAYNPFEDEGTLAWYKNTDGFGNFSDPQYLINDNKGAVKVYTADLDNDGDMDIIFCSINYYEELGLIGWFENLDGLGNFGTLQSITPIGNQGRSIHAGDLNGNGQIEIVSVSGTNVAWHENLGFDRNEIIGLIKMDTNSTGCENSGIPVQGLKVVTENGSESITTFTIGSGVYQLFPGEGDYTTTVSSTSLPDYYSLSPDSHFSNFTGIGFIDTADFCIETTQTINDLNIIFLPNGDARPGFEADYKIIYQNIGTTNLNDNIVLEFDETKMSFSKFKCYTLFSNHQQHYFRIY